jgi:hypothetical protein
MVPPARGGVPQHEELRGRGIKSADLCHQGTQVASRGPTWHIATPPVLNGSDRILFHGTPPRRMTPNGCLGSAAIVSLWS